jgi:hypothetical protein
MAGFSDVVFVSFHRMLNVVDEDAVEICTSFRNGLDTAELSGICGAAGASQG